MTKFESNRGWMQVYNEAGELHNWDISLTGINDTAPDGSPIIYDIQVDGCIVFITEDNETKEVANG